MGKYLSISEIRNTIYGQIEDATDDICGNLQDQLDIHSGDIFPGQAFDLDDLQEKLTELLTDILLFQFDSEEVPQFMVKVLTEEAGLDKSFVEELPLDDLCKLFTAYNSDDPGVFDDLLMRM